jgi:hypothetical protein
MGIREYHPDGDLDHPVTHVYEHPDSLGLGQHHADPDEDPLHERPAIPGMVLEHMLPEFRVTMADLDLQHGTKLAHVATDKENGLEIFAWTDKLGNQRRTSFTPEQAAGFLTPQAGNEKGAK